MEWGLIDTLGLVPLRTGYHWRPKARSIVDHTRLARTLIPRNQTHSFVAPLMVQCLDY